MNLIVDRKLTYDITGFYTAERPTITYTRDRWGLRGTYSDPGQIDILTIGGSTTDQRYLDDRDTWQAVMQRDLARPGRTFVVANAGMDGHTTYGHIASYERWFPLVPNLRPAFTVLYVGLNDAFVEAPNAFDGSAPGLPARITLAIKVNSAFYRLYQLLNGVVVARLAGLDHDAVATAALRYTNTPLHPAGMDAEVPKHLASFQSRFAHLLVLVRQSGARPICVSQPSCQRTAILECRITEYCYSCRKKGCLPRSRQLKSACAWPRR